MDPMNPLVVDYLRRKKEAEEAQAAGDRAAMAQDLIGAGLKGVGALMSGNEKPVVYAKGLNETGTPVTADLGAVAPDTTLLEKGAERSRASGKQNYDRAMSSFKDEQSLVDLGSKRDREARQDRISASEDDPNSPESQLAQAMASKMIPGRDFSGMSATALKTMLPTISKVYDSELDRKYKMAQIAATKSEKAAEKEELLKTPFGQARTADDAKKLKDAAEKKDKFDRIMKEMVELRKKHDGGATLNREDVARGKQLAGDAKIIYKDLANLGVLSASDNVLIDQVIPADPLEYNISGIWGQDPTKKKLESFRDDVSKDFEGSLNNRLREGTRTAPTQFPRQVRNPSTGESATVSNEQELNEAIAEGFQ